MNGKPLYKAESRVHGSSLRQGTTDVSALTVFLVVLAVIGLGAGLFTNGLYAYALFAAAAVLAILARIAQAGRQHAELMDALRDLQGRAE